MQSRLDHFWISANTGSLVLDTGISQFTDIISDHAEIFLDLQWRHKRRFSEKFRKVIWKSKLTGKIQEWKIISETFCEQRLKLETPSRSKGFKKIYEKLAKKFTESARKLFSTKQRRKKGLDPPIWLYVIRMIKKARRKPGVLSKELRARKIIWKYFPNIDSEDVFENILAKLKVEVKIFKLRKQES